MNICVCVHMNYEYVGVSTSPFLSFWWGLEEGKGKSMCSTHHLEQKAPSHRFLFLKFVLFYGEK